MTKTTVKTPAKTPAKATKKSAAAAAAVLEAAVPAKPVAYATGQVAAVHAQPFTRPPAFVPKKPRGS